MDDVAGRPSAAPDISEPMAEQVLTSALERASFLQNVSLELAGSLNVRRTVLQLLHMALPVLGDWAMVATFEGTSATLTSRGGRRRTGPLQVDLAQAGSSGLDRIRRVGQTELLYVALDSGSGDALASMIPEPGMRDEAAALRPADVLGVALQARGTTIGALVVIRGENRGYSEEDLELVEEFARRAAITLDSARIYEERAEVAAELQAGLRPPTLPELPGMRVSARFRAAAEHLDIGGDFYDVHGSDDDWSMVIGDVCGKGVAAAVLTGRARQTIRTATQFSRSPSTMLSVLNDVLYEAEADRFVTVACLRLQRRADGEVDVTVAVAGHPPPIVIRADGTVEQPRVGGTLAGVLPNLSYVEITLRLRRGDLVLLFTDGIYEAKGPEDFFGLDRLLDMLPQYAGAAPEVLCEAVEQRVVEHLDGRAHDDMALLALRCDG